MNLVEPPVTYVTRLKAVDDPDGVTLSPGDTGDLIESETKGDNGRVLERAALPEDGDIPPVGLLLAILDSAGDTVAPCPLVDDKLGTELDELNVETWSLVENSDGDP